MLSTYSVDQVFVRLRGGQLELLLVLENAAGARHRETLTFPTQNTIEGVRRGAKHLAYRGDIESVDGVRLRLEKRGGELKDEPSLKRIFINDFLDHSEDDE